MRAVVLAGGFGMRLDAQRLAAGETVSASFDLGTISEHERAGPELGRRGGTLA